jgi:predicted small secreted protein
MQGENFFLLNHLLLATAFFAAHCLTNGGIGNDIKTQANEKARLTARSLALSCFLAFACHLRLSLRF